MNCTNCGRQEVYAKGLCRKCYERQRHYKGALPPSIEERTRAKWIGRVVNGWEVIEVLPNSRALLKCKECGKTRIRTRANIEKQLIRPCVCRVEHLVPRTETQARVYKAVLHNKGSVTKAAADLGVSKQAVSSVLETMRRRMYED